MKYLCEKHGFLDPDERMIWNMGITRRWCIKCFNEMLDNFCGKLIEVKDEGEE